MIHAKGEVETCQNEKEKLIAERQEEQKLIQETLEEAFEERNDLENKWKKEFEQLRNFNSDREEHLLMDCEWQLRTMQKSCKEKIEVADKARVDAVKRCEEMEIQANEKHSEVMQLRPLESEVNHLRGLTNDQRAAIMMMTVQIDDLRTELETATIKCEIEIENMRKMKYKCEM